MKHNLLKTMLLLCAFVMGVGSAWADTYERLESIASIDESADYVLGVNGTGFHSSGTSSWGVCSNTSFLTYKLKKGTNNTTFTASTTISGTNYYLTVPTSNTFTMSNSSSNLILGTTQSNAGDDKAYAVTNSSTTTRHLRLNGTSGLRSYAGNTGTLAFFYKVVSASTPIDASWSVSPASVSVRASKTATATITTNYNGTLSVTSNNTSVATATINGKVITVTGVAEGSTTLTVTGDATSAYNAISKTIDVTVTANVSTPGTYDITPNNTFFGCDAFTTKPSGFTSATGTQDDVTITYNAASNAYINDTQCRAYSGTKLDFSVPNGYELTKVVFTADGTNWAGTHTATSGSMTDSKTWEGSAESFSITFGGKCYITKITATYAVASGLKTSTLTLSPATITVENGQTADGTYTLSDNEYDGELSVEVANEDIAEAILEDGSILVEGKAVGTTTLTISGPATATYNAVAAKAITINVTAALPHGISAIRDAITSTDNKNPNAFTVRLTDAVVTYVNGSNTYIEDENNALLIYKSSLGLTAGQKINGVVSGTGYVYNGLKEANAFTYSQANVTNDGVIPCTTVTVAEIADDIETYESRRVKIEGLSITVGMESRNATATQGSDEINIREQTSGITGDILSEGAYVYDMIAFPARFNEDIQLGVWKKSDITMGGTVNISNACTDGEYYYTTYSTTSTFKVPSDIIVSEVGVGNDGKLVVKAYETGAYVPANTGVLISSDTYGVHGFALSDNKGSHPAGVKNLLRPSGDDGITDEQMAEADADCTYYRLTMHDGTQIGFWWGYTDGAAFSLAANKAYLAVPNSKSADAKPISFWFGGEDDADAIKVVKADSNEVIYNLAGQRINKMQKGINIVNGKKVLK